MFDQYKNIQSVADDFKRLVLNAPAARRDLQPALDAISRFERCPWHKGAMEAALAQEAPGDSFYLNDYGRLEFNTHERDTLEIVSIVKRVLDRYATIMPPEEDESEAKMYETADAAEYLGITIDGLKYYINRAKTLKADGRVGRSLVFSKETLDTFNANRQGPGRPKQSEK